MLMSWKQPKYDDEDVNILVIAGIVLLAASLFFLPYKTLAEFNIPVKIEISNNFNIEQIDKQKLDYGILAPGSRVKREIKLSLSNAQPAKAYIEITGDVKEFLQTDTNKLLISQDTNIGITAQIPNDATMGVYEGNVHIAYKQTLARKVKNIFS